MLLALRSLWEEQASGSDVIVTGEGVAANPEVGTGVVLTAQGIFGGKRKRVRYWHEIIPRIPISLDVECMGEGVAARPRIGTGNVLTGVDFSDDELIALLMLDAA